MRPNPTILRWFSKGASSLALFWFTMTLLALIVGRWDFFSNEYIFASISAGLILLLAVRSWALRRWPLPDPTRGGEFGRIAGPRTTR
ncbi:MAG: hypothetical protein HEQ23_01390 [Tepidisphaera sp.]